MPPSTACAKTPSSGRKREHAQPTPLRSPAPDGDDHQDGGDAHDGGQRPVAELDQLVDPLLLVRHRGERAGHALRPGGAAQARPGEPDQAARDDDADLEHEVGDEHGAQVRTTSRRSRGAPVRARSEVVGLDTPSSVGRRRGRPVPGWCGVSRSSGRCATASTVATRAQASSTSRGTPARSPVHERRAQPVAERARGQHRGQVRQPHRQLAARDDHAAEGEQGHPEQVGDRPARPRRAGCRPAAGPARRRPSCRPAANTAPPDEPGPGRVPAQGQAQPADDDQLQGLDGRTATPLAPSSPPRPRGLTPSSRSTPYRRSNPVAMAWPVNAEEMTHRARTPGHREVDPAAGAQRGHEAWTSPTRAAHGSSTATSSCSPLRSRVPASKRAWASDPAQRAGAARRGLIVRPPGSGRSSGPRGRARR